MCTQAKVLKKREQKFEEYLFSKEASGEDNLKHDLFYPWLSIRIFE